MNGIFQQGHRQSEKSGNMDSNKRWNVTDDTARFFGTSLSWLKVRKAEGKTYTTPPNQPRR